ncbi:MAG: exosortase system-associated protein, TIGR04073 family [Candidatus Omnitrophota bacterium]
MYKKIAVVFVVAFALSLALSSIVMAELEGYDENYAEVVVIQRIPVIDADKIPYKQSPLNKLDRGIINGATFWAELPAEVAKVSKEQNPAMGATVGVVQGTITSVIRAGTALFDTFTFFIPPYDKSIMRPEYAVNRADAKMKDLFW